MTVLSVAAPIASAHSRPRRALWRPPLFVPGALTLGAAAVTVDVLAGGASTRLDHAIASWDAAGRWPQLRDVAAWVVVSGQRGPVVIVVLAVVGVMAMRRRSWRLLTLPIAAIGALNAVVGALKLGIGRTAPYSGRDELFAGGTLFPSGHAANSVLMWGVLAVVLLTDGVVRRRWPLIVAVAAVSVLVGAASIYLGTHWLTDVLAGWLLGGALLAVLAATAPVAMVHRRTGWDGRDLVRSDLRHGVRGRRTRGLADPSGVHDCRSARLRLIDAGLLVRSAEWGSPPRPSCSAGTVAPAEGPVRRDRCHDGVASHEQPPLVPTTTRGRRARSARSPDWRPVPVWPLSVVGSGRRGLSRQ